MIANFLGFLEKARYHILLLLFGVILAVLSIYRVEDIKKFSLQRMDDPSYPLLVIGAVLIAGSFAGAIYGPVSNALPAVGRGIREANGGFMKNFGHASLSVVFGKIEDVAKEEETSLVVLPANEFFDDECIHDRRSALGAYVQAHFSNRTESLQVQIKEQLSTASPKQVEVEPGLTKLSYGLGKSVFLDKPQNSRRRMLLVAVTTQRSGEGLRADIVNLFQAVREVHRTVVAKRMDEVVLPLLGAGHGCIPATVALFCQLVAWTEILCTPNPPRLSVRIVVYQKDAGIPPEVPRKQARQMMSLVAGMYRTG